MTEETSAVLGVAGGGGRVLGNPICHKAGVGSRLGLALYAAV